MPNIQRKRRFVEETEVEPVIEAKRPRRSEPKIAKRRLKLDTIEPETSKRTLANKAKEILPPVPDNPSIFASEPISKLEVAENIIQEMHHMKMKKSLSFSPAALAELRMDDTISPRHAQGPLDEPTFTQSQVEELTKRLLEKYEIELRERYDKQLEERLAEQHNSYVEYIFEEVRKRYSDTPDYIS